jgi:hypothetical protein
MGTIITKQIDAATPSTSSVWWEFLKSYSQPKEQPQQIPNCTHRIPAQARETIGFRLRPDLERVHSLAFWGRRGHYTESNVTAYYSLICSEFGKLFSKLLENRTDSLESRTPNMDAGYIFGTKLSEVKEFNPAATSMSDTGLTPPGPEKQQQACFLSHQCVTPRWFSRNA